MVVQPYLSFEGRAEEAINFYVKALGAEVTALMRYEDNQEVCNSGMVPPGSEKKVMHSAIRIGETTLMASDGGCKGNAKFEGISLSLSAATDKETERLFKALADGGQVQMPLDKTFFTSKFGMVADRFGVSWMVLTTPETVPA
ncbi:MAG TPA: VOC family protein [Burkholderiaceae bacterium]|nr:VOC family protein [Burkholderiaceae bacterium]